MESNEINIIGVPKSKDENIPNLIREIYFPPIENHIESCYRMIPIT